MKKILLYGIAFALLYAIYLIVMSSTNGKRFVNPTLEEQFSPKISDVFKMRREGREKWRRSGDGASAAASAVMAEKAEGFWTRLKEKEVLQEGEVAVTFVGHATFLIRTSGLTILTDPVWSDRASPVRWAGPERVTKPGVELDSLPAVDVVLISHNHYDHLDRKTLKALEKRFSPLVLVPVGDKKRVQSFGVKNVQELDWWESVEVNESTTITFTPQQHGSGRGLFDRNKSLWGSFFIRQGERSLYFGGDGGYSTHFADIKERLGSPDIALLGIGSYKPEFFMKPIHTSPYEAVIAHKDLGAKQSIGMHFGTFQMSSEGFEEPVQDLKTAIEKEGLAEDEFIVMQEGETKFAFPRIITTFD
jgi:L-ascorbate metabolism protein UlaG (beta-lactamase superfamily)